MALTPTQHRTFGLLLALPALWLIAEILREAMAPGSRLGADPADAVVDYLGLWSIRLLLLTLAVSPLRRWLGRPELAPLRRTTGLFAFGYVCAHVLAYAVLLNGLEWAVLLEDLTERRYIIAGAVAFGCLLPLAITSTRRWQRRLRRNWIRLHRLVFVAAAAAVLHLLWLTRSDYGEPLFYLAVLALLVAERLSARRPAPVAA
ncbi:MAG: ferric reductase-like transmembrane domain-containing protein [Pseudomonadota bacterium]